VWPARLRPSVSLGWSVAWQGPSGRIPEHGTGFREVSMQHPSAPLRPFPPRSFSLWHEDNEPHSGWHAYCSIYVSIWERRFQERTRTRREMP
jgi:hypothetical protein